MAYAKPPPEPRPPVLNKPRPSRRPPLLKKPLLKKPDVRLQRKKIKKIKSPERGFLVSGNGKRRLKYCALNDETISSFKVLK